MNVRFKLPLSLYIFGYKPSVMCGGMSFIIATALLQVFATFSERVKSAMSIENCKVSTEATTCIR